MKTTLAKPLRLVVCDIDSTLTTSQHVLTPHTKEVIEVLRHNGVLFGIASGRPLDEIEKRAHTWGFQENFDILIGLNGSQLWDELHQKEYSYHTLKREWIKEIIELMSRFESNYFIYHHGYILCKREDEMMHKSAKSSDKHIVVCHDDSEMYAEENAKIMFRVKEEHMQEIEEYIAKHPNEHYKGFKTQTTLMEFADHRTSKAYALEQYCDMNDISIDSVITFGDTTNDNEMLSCSGMGVCMCNGSDDTKAIADIITEKSNDEDGVAYFLETYFPMLCKR